MSTLHIKQLSAAAGSADSAISYIGIFFIIIPLILFVGLAFIPASIVKKKGYSFGLYWLFGFFLFFPALIVSLCIEDRNDPRQHYQQTASVSTADELKKYSELHNQGVITDEEFEKVKSNILNKLP